MTTLRVEHVNRANVRQACEIKVKPGQERYVAPVAQSLAEAYVEPENAWPRLIYAGSELVAFVMGGFRPDDPLMTSTLWRLNVSTEAQRQGVGLFAVRAVAAEARRRGHHTLTTAYVLGPQSPEDFYLAIGFRPTGRSAGGMYEAAIRIDDLLPPRAPR